MLSRIKKYCIKLRVSQFRDSPPNPPEGGLKLKDCVTVNLNLEKEFKSPPPGDLGGFFDRAV